MHSSCQVLDDFEDSQLVLLGAALTPSPSPRISTASSDPFSLQRFVQRIMGLDMTRASLLPGLLAMVPKEGKYLHVGSLCSGTDGIIKCLEARLCQSFSAMQLQVKGVCTCVIVIGTDNVGPIVI